MKRILITAEVFIADWNSVEEFKEFVEIKISGLPFRIDTKFVKVEQLSEESGEEVP